MDKDAVRLMAADMLGMTLSDAESAALAVALQGATRSMAALPAQALKELEPPLGAQPGPRTETE